jgi:hypothetical protein
MVFAMLTLNYQKLQCWYPMFQPFLVSLLPLGFRVKSNGKQVKCLSYNPVKFIKLPLIKNLYIYIYIFFLKKKKIKQKKIHKTLGHAMDH